MERAQRGDHDAFAALATGAGTSLLRVARLILRDADRAEDAVQEALVKAWRELPRLRDPDRFTAWLRRLVVNACYDESRRTRWRVEVRLLPTHDPAALDSTDVIDDRDAIERGFRRLTVEQRAVLVLYHYLGLTIEEVAQSLKMPAGTAKSRLHYAKSAMRAALEADARTTMAQHVERPA